jgi:hypothetical protein
MEININGAEGRHLGVNIRGKMGATALIGASRPLT